MHIGGDEAYRFVVTGDHVRADSVACSHVWGWSRLVRAIPAKLRHRFARAAPLVTILEVEDGRCGQVARTTSRFGADLPVDPRLGRPNRTSDVVAGLLIGADDFAADDRRRSVPCTGSPADQPGRRAASPAVTTPHRDNGTSISAGSHADPAGAPGRAHRLGMSRRRSRRLFASASRLAPTCRTCSKLGSISRPGPGLSGARVRVSCDDGRAPHTEGPRIHVIQHQPR